MTTSHDHHLDLQSVGETVAVRGIDAVEPALLAAVAARALSLGASTTLVELLLAADEPAVARARAFGRLADIAGRPARDRFALAA
jgi:hypothetical protein